MKRFISLTILILALCLFVNHVCAQIVYSNNKISINGGVNQQPGFSFTIALDSCSGLFWNYPSRSGQRFLGLDMTNASPRLFGSSNQIVFYNSLTQSFNSIECSNVYQQSDGRSKKNIKTISAGLSQVLNLRPVSFNWKTRNDISNCNSEDSFWGPDNEQGTQYGFIAQEIEESIPEIVSTDEDGHKLVNYTAIIPMLVQSIQELQMTVEKQAKRIEYLETSNSIFCAKKKSNKVSILVCSIDSDSKQLLVTVKKEKNCPDVSVELCSLTGEIVKEVTLVETETASVDVSEVKDGVYCVSFFADGQFLDSRRVVK